MRKYLQIFRIQHFHHLFAIVTTIVYVITDQKQLYTIKISSELLSNTITIFAILIGFVGTIQILILSLQNTKIIRNLKTQEFRSGCSYYNLYIGQLNTTIRWGFIAVLFSLLILVLNAQYTDEKMAHIAGEIDFRKLAICLWVYSLAASAASFYQAIIGMNSILSSRGNSE